MGPRHSHSTGRAEGSLQSISLLVNEFGPVAADMLLTSALVDCPREGRRASCSDGRW